MLQGEYPSLMPDKETLDYHKLTVVKNGMKSRDFLTEYDVSLVKGQPPQQENIYQNTQQTDLPTEVNPSISMITTWKSTIPRKISSVLIFRIYIIHLCIFYYEL